MARWGADLSANNVIASERRERGNLISQGSGVSELNNGIITHSSNAHNDINNSSPMGEARWRADLSANNVIASERRERGNLISQGSGVLELNNGIITHYSNAHNDINCKLGFLPQRGKLLG